MSLRRVEARAAAKINLSLYVSAPRSDGRHPLRGRFQSIDWYDNLVIDPALDPTIVGASGRPVVDDERNLAWLAAKTVMGSVGSDARFGVELDKQIAVAAGLGGGSADAAATLAATAFGLGLALGSVAGLAPSLGSDVPFCLVGGTADVTGVGDIVEPVAPGSNYAVALVVPPVELATSDIYLMWDRLDGPIGEAVDPAALPPSLRDGPDVRNDLTPAAVALAPLVAEWRTELAATWSRPVVLSGSGPTLFGFFLDAEEAADAVRVVPAGARQTRVARPVPHGWVVSFDGDVANDELAADATLGGPWHAVRSGVLGAMFR